MIGAPLHSGLSSEVIPVAPRADVRAPLVMERLVSTSRGLREEATGLAQVLGALPAPWQRLVTAAFDGYEAQFIYERFVGVTLRELCLGLRTTGRVLPMDVLRTLASELFDGLGALSAVPPRTRPFLLSDRSVGLGIDGRWRFAHGALNHWLADVTPDELATDPEYDGAVPTDTLFFFSPETIVARPETPASLATRAALLLYQLTTGGFHPYRGDRYSQFQSLARYGRSELRLGPDVNPRVSDALASALVRAVRFDGERFASIDALRAALEPSWPEPAASPQRVFDVVAGLTWKTLQQQLELLRREPMLPIYWDGVWPASRTPEEGLAVLEDQLLERLVAPESLPERREVPADAGDRPTPTPQVQPQPPPEPPRVNLAPAPQPPAGLFARVLAFFRGRRAG